MDARFFRRSRPEIDDPFQCDHSKHLRMFRDEPFGDVSQQTQAALERQLNDPAISDHILDDPAKPLAVSVALILGSPEFQRR